ncbi:hypothetical protein HZB93_04505 [Candidatus Falkowbacteria bacterium]|nr:hypothetical protein [Candidatus Falkowbacteria bacterium]
MDWRKILIVVAFVAVTLGIGFLMYYVFFRPTTPPVVTPITNEVVTPGGLGRALEGPPTPVEVTSTPTQILAPSLTPPPQLPKEISSVAKGGVTWVGTLVNKPINNATLASNGKDIAYYDKNVGKFYRVDENGNVSQLSDKTFQNVEKVTWTNATDKAILEFPDGANVVFDFTSQKQFTLPKHWEGFSFSPDGTEIAGKSIGIDPDNRWLFTSNPDGTGVKAIEPLGDNGDKVEVNWSPNNQIIVTSRTGQAMGFERQQILLIGQNHENFPGLTVEGQGFQSEWSKTGDRLLYSVYNSSSEYKPVLWVTSAQGDNIGANRRSLQINTWADKCSFSDDTTLYCAVPQTMETGAGFQPDLFSSVPDSFYRVDLTTGLKSLVAVPYGSFTASNVMVSADGRYLTFTNSQTGRLERIQIK